MTELEKTSETQLSAREIQILHGYLAGKAKQQIADEMSLSRETIRRALDRDHVAAAARAEIIEAQKRVQSLFPQAIEVFADALADDDVRVRMAAADKIVRLMPSASLEADGAHGGAVPRPADQERARAKLIQLVREKAEAS